MLSPTSTTMLVLEPAVQLGHLLGELVLGFEPVPKSPSTPNLNEPFLLGSATGALGGCRGLRARRVRALRGMRQPVAVTTTRLMRAESQQRIRVRMTWRVTSEAHSR